MFYIYFLSSTYEYAHINGGIYYVSNNPMPEVPGGAWHPRNRVLQESGIISTPSFYKWRNGELNLSDATLERIDSYLSKYGF